MPASNDNDIQVSALDADIGANLREARQRRGVTLGELALATDTAIGELSAYEDGRARVPALKMFEICHAIGLPLKAVFDKRR